MSETYGSLRLADVAVEAGNRRILDGVDLEIPAGTIVAVIGPNGAGKTTLLDAISGTVPNITGTVALPNGGGARPGHPRAGVGRVFQGSPLPETLTVAEVCSLAAGNRTRAEPLLIQFGLQQYATRFVSELSTGMRRILDLAVAAAGSPSVLLLDEPASGLAQSEIEYLADVVRVWRDSTGGAVVMVEHDAWLVNAVADRVVMMEAGRVESDGTPDHVMNHVRSKAKPRMRSPADPAFAEALHRIADEASEGTELITRTVSAWTIMRLGFREFAAGLASVLLLGVLNRVLKVELGINLAVVAALLASYNLAAPFALAIGHRSDSRPIFGLKRTPYIIGGSAISAVALILTPHLTTPLANGIEWYLIVGSIALLVMMGIGMYTSGAVFLALLADVVPARERGYAISLVFIELSLGIMAGVFLTVGVIENDASNISTLFAIAGLIVVTLTTLGIWGQERRAMERSSVDEEPHEYVPFGRAIRNIISIPQARVFFGFMVLATCSIFLQQAVLEPYGGDVLGLSVKATSGFNGVMTVGTLIAMYVSGRTFAPRWGNKKLARYGLLSGALAFTLLALSAAAGAPAPSWLAIFGVGIAVGSFTVAGLALMMEMADKRHTALFMGTWTVGRAIADATAVAGGGAVFEAVRAATGGTAGSYAAVFALEAVGLLLCLPLLRRVEPSLLAEQMAAAEPGAGA